MSDIKVLVMDVDGTLTDGKIYMGADGEMFKAFNIKDGYGINDILRSKGIMPVIITGRQSKIVENRCKELHIHHLHQGIHDKLGVLKQVLEQLKLGEESELSLENVAYIGDDCNDLVCMQAVKAAGGLVGCPADAVKQVIDIAEFVSSKNGGDGAVREFIEWFVKNI